MKNISILLLLWVAISWVACNENDTVAPAIVGMEITGDDLLTGDSLMYDTTSRTSVLQVLVSGEWGADLVEEADWCGVTRSMLPGVNKLLVNVSSNQAPEERSCTIKVTGGGQERTLTVWQLGATPALKVAPEQFTTLTSDSAVIRFRVITNVPFEVKITEGDEWILPLEQTGVDTTTFRFAIRNNGATNRSGKIVVGQKEGYLVKEIPVFQQARSSDYTPGDPNSLGEAVKLEVDRATAVSVLEPDNPDYHYGTASIKNSFDGNYDNQYNSLQGNEDVFPITLTYYLKEASKVDYINYYPRKSGTNGNFGEFTLEYQVNNGSFVKYGDYDFGKKSTLSTILFSRTLENVTAVRFIVNSGAGNFVSCAEMEFYRKPTLSAAADLFTDKTCSALKPEVTRAQIQALSDEDDSFLKQLALSIFDGNYPMERVATYQPYMTVETLAAKLKTTAYNKFENPTGIYFEANERAVIFVEDIETPISLCVMDWTEEGNETSSYYTLTSGPNLLTINNKGLAYISYYTDNYESAPDVKIHIASGLLNGYFDLERGDQNTYWQSLIENEETAACGMLDIRGKYVQLAFDKASLSAKNIDRGVEMIQEYDNIIKMEQDIMGIDQFGWRTTNRMFARRSYSGNPNANDLGVSFPSLNVIPENIRANSWEIGHEFGHVNQVRPGLKWQGTTEVTNNIYSATVQYHYTPDNLRLEQEKIGDGEGGASMVGNRFNCYFNNGIIGGQNWLFQKGQNNPNPETGAGDLFVRLCPFWQLQLFNKIAGLGVEDFYPQLIEIIRRTDETGLSNKELQFNFMRNTCKVMNVNMLDFFEKCGMLKPYDHEVSDYGGAIHLIITQEEVDEFKAEINAMNYPQPVSPVIYYISGNSVDAFKNKAAVVGTTGKGVSGSGSSRLVTASVWKNVVVFETYVGNELVKATLPFTNYADKSATTVAYPDGSTRIEAVGWDGTRTLVYGTR
ncbi:MAG: M60 family metallopeptidase [Odoribacter sp.]